jgi:hypothetical protein
MWRRKVAAALVVVAAVGFVPARPAVAAYGPSGATCARQVVRTTENRPMNVPANRAIPIDGVDYRKTDQWPTWAFSTSAYRQRVDGNYRGTTDEIVQWAACKWNVPADVLRAVLVTESWGDASSLGDGGESIGLVQIKPAAALNVGVTAAAALSSAWALDYYGAMLRACMDGQFVLWRDRPDLVRYPYAPGDLWGCVEAWYTGVGPTSSSVWYGDRVRQYLDQRRWLAADYTAWTGWADWCAATGDTTYWNCVTRRGS